MPVERRAFARTFPAEPLAIRSVVTEAAAHLCAAGLGVDTVSGVELVLAEALNNVQEHAYARTGGTISLVLRWDGRTIRCDIRDTGEPMPVLRLPEGRLPEPGGPDLPEGGFGWHLIRVLSSRVAYERRAGRNRLTLLFDAERLRTDDRTVARPRPTPE